MLRTMLAGSAILSLAACLHTPVPIDEGLGAYGSVPLEARVWASSFGGGDISIQLSRPAYVAVFEIAPGQGTRLLYPRFGQAELLSAGNHHPALFGRGSGLFRSSVGSRWGSSLVGDVGMAGWAQPRHIFLVAADEPMLVDRIQASAEGSYGLLRNVSYGVFSANVVMNNLLDVLLPTGFRGDWVTDVFTIWPEPPYRDPMVREARTTRPLWVTCNGNTVYVPAGVRVSSLNALITSGCTLSATAPAAPGQPTPPDTGAKPDTMTVRDTVRTPVRPPLATRPESPRIATGDDAGRREVLERIEEARARAAARAGERARGPARATTSERFDPREARRPTGETQRATRPVGRVATPGQVDRGTTGETRSRPANAGRATPGAAQRTTPRQGERTAQPQERTRTRAEPARTDPRTSRPRAEPTRPRGEPSRPARTEPSRAERPRETPAQRSAPPRAEPARSAPPPRAEPPKRSDPPKTEQPAKRTEPPPERTGSDDGAAR